MRKKKDFEWLGDVQGNIPIPKPVDSTGLWNYQRRILDFLRYNIPSCHVKLRDIEFILDDQLFEILVQYTDWIPVARRPADCEMRLYIDPEKPVQDELKRVLAIVDALEDQLDKNWAIRWSRENEEHKEGQNHGN